VLADKDLMPGFDENRLAEIVTDFQHPVFITLGQTLARNRQSERQQVTGGM
jgi:hypothetical protein